MLHRFATHAMNRTERSRQWCALTRADHVEFADDREASLRGGDFGQLRLCLVSMGSHRVVQARPAKASGGAPALKFLFQEEGNATVRQGGLENRIQAGQWCAIRKDIGYEIDAPGPSRQLSLTVPCELVPGQRRGIQWWRRPRGYLRGAAQILHASASASVLSGGSLSQKNCEQLGGQLAQMVEMTLCSDTQDSFPDLREERRRAVLEFIDDRLAESGLDVGQIAHEFGCSSRTIHKLFEGEAHTVGRAIWERRLERCRHDMIDPSLASRSITQIAHHWGFSDSQHFSRAFKARFGITPREYRTLYILN
ncbi:MAG: helix-turn-helix domain-containing protein [Altererythrobacter sp.]|nr:helix-turn-helix domain-containing protein [Altererythrobacter sp.]